MTTIDDLIALPPESSRVVIAGPGTGTTHRIGERIASLLGQAEKRAIEHRQAGRDTNNCGTEPEQDGGGAAGRRAV